MGKTPKNSGKEAEVSIFLSAAMTELQEQLQVLTRRRRELPVGGFDKDLSNASAALGRAITGLAGEQRQQERHDRSMVERMDPSERDGLVKVYLRELTTERRAEIRVLLAELDASERVLGL